MKKPRVYRDRRPLVTALRVTAAAIVLALALCIFIFFWFRRYIVIENDVLRLEPPWEQTETSQ